jgi:hypothetical protein
LIEIIVDIDIMRLYWRIEWFDVASSADDTAIKPFNPPITSSYKLDIMLEVF